MLQACLNGGRSKAEAAAVPASAEELAADAAAVRQAGAEALHVHPRDDQGRETLEPDLVAHCLTAIRGAVPDMPVGIGTGAWIEPDDGRRLDLIRSWMVVPDYASVNLNEAAAPEVMDVLLAKGIGVEAGLWTRADAERFVALPQADRCLRILIEMTSDDPSEAHREYLAIMDILNAAGLDLPLLLHGEGGSVWPMVHEAARIGGSTRVGFEDGLTLPDGRPALDNAALVRAAVEIVG